MSLIYGGLPHMIPLSDAERIHHRDLLRSARYAALADAEGFQQMCFAIEALGKRLNPNAQGLRKCQGKLKELVAETGFIDVDGVIDGPDKRFDALFTALTDARNDIAHTGAYARHVAVEAVAICVVLEDALMNKRITVGDFMVATPVTVQPWHSVGYARQLMLLNSFSYLPVWHHERWWLLSDVSVAKYLRPEWPARKRIKKTIEEANKEFDFLVKVSPVDAKVHVASLLEEENQPGLWLVVENGYPEGHLSGVLSPFELM
jgi:hypothetical protein